MTKDQFIEWAKGKGWADDGYEHLQKTQLDGNLNPVKYRLKIGANSVRCEVQINHKGTEYSKPSNEWMRLRSGYFKDLKITDDNKLSGMKR